MTDFTVIAFLLEKRNQIADAVLRVGYCGGDSVPFECGPLVVAYAAQPAHKTEGTLLAWCFQTSGRHSSIYAMFDDPHSHPSLEPPNLLVSLGNDTLRSLLSEPPASPNTLQSGVIWLLKPCCKHVAVPR
jgi:hypothetical protein